MQILFKDEALKKLQKINKSDINKIKRKIELLKINPLAGKPLHGEFAGTFTLRAWPLRIIYTFNPKLQQVIIITIDYRGSVYK